MPITCAMGSCLLQQVMAQHGHHVAWVEVEIARMHFPLELGFVAHQLQHHKLRVAPVVAVVPGLDDGARGRHVQGALGREVVAPEEEKPTKKRREGCDMDKPRW